MVITTGCYQPLIDITDLTGPNAIRWLTEPSDPSFVNVQLRFNNSTTFFPIMGLLDSNGTIMTDVSIHSLEVDFIPSW